MWLLPLFLQSAVIFVSIRRELCVPGDAGAQRKKCLTKICAQRKILWDY
jgi:hypothetical protein